MAIDPKPPQLPEPQSPATKGENASRPVYDRSWEKLCEQSRRRSYKDFETAAKVLMSKRQLTRPMLDSLRQDAKNARVLQALSEAWAVAPAVPEENAGVVWVGALHKEGAEYLPATPRSIVCTVAERGQVANEADPASLAPAFERIASIVAKAIRKTVRDAHPSWHVRRTSFALDVSIKSANAKDRSFELAAAVAMVSSAFNIKISSGTLAMGFLREDGVVEPLDDDLALRAKCIGIAETMPFVDHVLVSPDEHTFVKNELAALLPASCAATLRVTAVKDVLAILSALKITNPKGSFAGEREIALTTRLGTWLQRALGLGVGAPADYARRWDTPAEAAVQMGEILGVALDVLLCATAYCISHLFYLILECKHVQVSHLAASGISALFMCPCVLLLGLAARRRRSVRAYQLRTLLRDLANGQTITLKLLHIAQSPIVRDIIRPMHAMHPAGPVVMLGVYMTSWTFALPFIVGIPDPRTPQESIPTIACLNFVIASFILLAARSAASMWISNGSSEMLLLRHQGLSMSEKIAKMQEANLERLRRNWDDVAAALGARTSIGVIGLAFGLSMHLEDARGLRLVASLGVMLWALGAVVTYAPKEHVHNIPRSRILSIAARWLLIFLATNVTFGFALRNQEFASAFPSVGLRWRAFGGLLDAIDHSVPLGVGFGLTYSLLVALIAACLAFCGVVRWGSVYAEHYAYRPHVDSEVRPMMRSLR